MQVGCGDSAPVFAYDLISQSCSHLLGHAGGVQALAFVSDELLVSVGLDDATLRLHATSSGKLVCSTHIPLRQLCVATCVELSEFSAGGEDGVCSWRVVPADQPDKAEEHGIASLATLRCIEPNVASEALASRDASITALHYLDGPQIEAVEVGTPTRNPTLLIVGSAYLHTARLAVYSLKRAHRCRLDARAF